MQFKDHDNLIRHSAFLMAATMVTHVTNLLFQMVMMRRLSVVEYGAMAAMLGLAAIVSTPLDAVRTGAAHFAARLCQSGRPDRIVKLVFGWGRATAGVAILILLAGLVFGRPGAAFFQLDSPALIMISALGMAVLIFTPLLVGALQGMQAFGSLAALWICWGAVRLAVGTALVCLVSATAFAALSAHAIGALAGVLAGAAGLAVFLRRDSAATDISEPCPPERSASGGAAYLIKSLIVLLSYSVLMTADISMVKHFFEPGEAGVFARAATVGRSIIFLPMPVAMAMFPKVVSDGATSDCDRQTLRRAFACVFLIIVAACIVAYALAEYGWYVFAGDWPDARSLALLRLALLAMAPLGLTYTAMNFELAQRRFTTLWTLIPIAALYILGVMLWHQTLTQVLHVMFVVNIASAILLTAGAFHRRSEVLTNK